MRTFFSKTRSVLVAVLALVLALTCLPAVSRAATDFAYTVSGGKATVTAYLGYEEYVVVPDTLGGYPVTAIGGRAFSGCDNLISVTIPDSVTSIGDSAFMDCYSLRSMAIPDKVTAIGDSAFAYCSSLRWVTFGKSLKTIGAEAFNSCNTLGWVILPDSVTSVGDYAFRDCSGMKSVEIGDGLTELSTGMFYGCTQLETATLGDRAEIIGAYAFYGCGKLAAATGPLALNTIGDYAFDGCISLRNVYYAGGMDEGDGIHFGINNDDLLGTVVHFGHVHNYTKKNVTTEATCAEAGSAVYTCAHGETYKAVIAPTGHKYVTVPAVAPTCTKTGLTAGSKCDNCGQVAVAQTTVAATGHTMQNGVCIICSADFTGDGIVTDADAVYLLRHTLFSQEYPITGNGDVNCDKEITDADAVYLLRYTLFPGSYPLYPEG